MITNVDRPMRSRPLGQLIVVDGPGELRQGFGRGTGGVAELRSRGGRRGQPDHLAAAVAPRPNQGAHGGGLPGASGGDRELQPRPGGAHGTNQSRLSGVQAVPVRGGFQQRQLDRGGVQDASVGAARSGDESLLGGQDAGGGVQLGSGNRVDT